MNDIKIWVNGEPDVVEKDSTLLELSKRYQEKFKQKILVAKIDGRYKELFHHIRYSCQIEFCDLNDTFANRIYVNGLILLANYACKSLFGNRFALKVLHSIDKGIYIETSRAITKEELMDVKVKMNQLISQALPIEKVNVSRMDAIEYFKNIHNDSKVKLLNYTTNTYITLYKLGNMYEYLYSMMPVSTDVFTDFDLTYVTETGFVLQFPTPYMEKIEPYQEHKQMFEVFEEYRSWKELMSLDNVADLNKKVSTGKIADIIRIDEVLQSNRLLQLAKQIHSRKDELKIVLLSGPSSSGKTTTCRKLAMYLESFGLHPKTISMDDYFRDNKDSIIRPDGKPDYECLEAIDLNLFDDQISKLLNGEEVLTPTFNFLLGMKEFKNRMKLAQNDILMIEGIHALDPKILTNIPDNKKYKVYLSPLIELNIDNLTRISTTDNRLLRRLVRDNRTRGHGVDYTLASWQSVREGEEKYIFPCQDYADYTFNTALSYEIGVLKTYAEPLLYSVPVDSPYYDEAKRLIDMLQFFLPIPSEDIPDDSILREFIGRSCFHD